MLEREFLICCPALMGFRFTSGVFQPFTNLPIERFSTVSVNQLANSALSSDITSASE
jgi:hypothetical protein